MDLSIIQTKIFELRGQRVMLDFDLAALYGVTTGNLNKAVKRNIERFPERFMFRLNNEEFRNLTFQIGISKQKGGVRYLPYAFTEQGVSMLSAVLRSPTAVQVSLSIMDAFVAMRNLLMQTSLASVELAELRSRLQLVEHEARENLEAMNDLSEDVRRDIDNIYEAIGALSVSLQAAKKPKQKIGYKK